MNAVNALRNKTRVSDRYEIREQLGANGLSITYKAFDTFRETYCVLKELFPETIVARSFSDHMQVEVKRLSDEELYKRMAEHMIRQAKGMIRLYPLEGISNIITCFEENNTVYVVSEFVEGTPLAEFLKHRKAERFELAAILNFFSPMTESLKKLHENHIYHGKIRPDQIMVTKKNGVRLVGFADPMEDVVSTAFLEAELPVRDHRYSSVEQFMEGGKLGSYTDVYGLAATVYHCITRTEPMDFYNRIGRKDRMKSPAEMKIDITDLQSEAMMKALAPHDFDRYQTIGEWLADIYNGADSDEFKEAKPIILYQPPFAFLQKLKFRRRVLAAAAAVALILLLAMIPGIAGSVRNARVLRFYRNFVKEDLYGQCEALKWLGKDDRDRFANDYTRRAERDEMEPVYYDVRGKRMLDRTAFLNKGKVYEIVEIDFRENNVAFVVFYDRESTRTLIVDLNNLGEAYQVTEQVETVGKRAVVRSLSVDKDETVVLE